jgi:hypothetical protein
LNRGVHRADYGSSVEVGRASTPIVFATSCVPRARLHLTQAGSEHVHTLNSALDVANRECRLLCAAGNRWKKSVIPVWQKSPVRARVSSWSSHLRVGRSAFTTFAAELTCSCRDRLIVKSRVSTWLNSGQSAQGCSKFGRLRSGVETRGTRHPSSIPGRTWT